MGGRVSVPGGVKANVSLSEKVLDSIQGNGDRVAVDLIHLYRRGVGRHPNRQAEHAELRCHRSGRRGAARVEVLSPHVRTVDIDLSRFLMVSSLRA